MASSGVAEVMLRMPSKCVDLDRDHPQSIRGNVGPLGLLGFGMTTCMLMFLETTWAEPSFKNTVFGYAAIYGGLAQLVAGIFEYIKGNTFAGSAFASYGCFWIGWFIAGLINANARFAQPTLKLATESGTTGDILFLLLWGTFTLMCFVVTLRKNHCLMFIFGSLMVTFYLLAAGVKYPDAGKAGGYVGFLCGSSAIYTAFAEIYEDALGIHMPGLKPVAYI